MSETLPLRGRRPWARPVRLDARKAGRWESRGLETCLVVGVHLPVVAASCKVESPEKNTGGASAQAAEPRDLLSGNGWPPNYDRRAKPKTDVFGRTRDPYHPRFNFNPNKL